ncbi:MAG TPA: hypothetical protein VMI54_09245 [Polyangiaceae bacterium]|nr:hypothetical protein [Polyangiaceae bacterium]
MGAFSALPSRASLVAVGFGSLVLAGCPVDERALGERAGPLAESAGGAAGDDFPQGFDASGQGGADAAGVIGSWGFAHDTSGWQAESDVDQSFSTLDADGSAQSGSLLLTNTGIGTGNQYHARGSSVCLSVAGGVTYDMFAKIRIDRGQNTGSAGFVVEFFNAPDCEGLMLNLTSYATATTERWVLAKKTEKAPDATQSAQFRLIASKLEADPPFSARFDDVTLRAE